MMTRFGSNKKQVRIWWRAIAVALLGVGLFAGAAGATTSIQDEWADDFLQALTEGTPTLNVRGRIEVAEITGFQQSEAYTVRTRLGYGTKPWQGVSLFADFENIATAAAAQYQTRPGGPKTIIVDPTGTEFNQYFVKIARDDLLHSSLKAGKQRITLHDHRFVGNVGWRQNEQTYDAVRLETSLGVDDLNIQYAFIGNVYRVNFAKQGGRIHLVDTTYGGFKPLKMTAFAYLMDFTAPNFLRGASNQTYGLRGTGKVDFNDKWNLGYILSWAIQMDYGSTKKDYTAHYALLEGTLGYKPLGAVGLAWELLGSDNGRGSVVTPLATGHKFNGWADAFLPSNSPNGLRDLYFYIAPKMPWKLKGKVIYHYFSSDNGGAALGHEVDAILTRPINKYVDLLAKGAYLNGNSTRGPANRWRFWFDVTVKF